jgi:tetratricopeptide (TPR) repeat protein
MPDSNETVFFIDDDLIERLMRGDTAPADPTKKKRPATVSALATAVKFATDGKLDEAVKELERAAAEGENPVEVETGLGHLRFEQQKWDEAARSYAKVIELDPKHRTAHYNLGLVLERQG